MAYTMVGPKFWTTRTGRTTSTRWVHRSVTIRLTATRTGLFFFWFFALPRANLPCRFSFGAHSRSLEIHLMDKIDGDLYDKQMKVVFCGFIRPQLQLTIEELKKAIQNDIQVSARELEKSAAKKLKVTFFCDFFLKWLHFAFPQKKTNPYSLLHFPPEKDPQIPELKSEDFGILMTKGSNQEPACTRRHW